MKHFLIILSLFTLLSCTKDSGKNSKEGDSCGFYNGKKLYRGERNGCYYLQEDGQKTYVDRSHCSFLNN